MASKYRAKKTEVCGIVFDSKKEANRYRELLELEKRGEIKDLCIQVPFELLPAQKRVGLPTERAVKYIADFVYFLPDGTQVVEDVKGVRTHEYVMKRKMMLYFYKIQIREI